MDISVHNITRIEQELKRFTAKESGSGEPFVVLHLYVMDKDGNKDEIKLFAANSDLLVFFEKP